MILVTEVNLIIFSVDVAIAPQQEHLPKAA
jgi:hypothetical protein